MMGRYLTEKEKKWNVRNFMHQTYVSKWMELQYKMNTIDYIGHSISA